MDYIRILNQNKEQLEKRNRDEIVQDIMTWVIQTTLMGGEDFKSQYWYDCDKLLESYGFLRNGKEWLPVTEEAKLTLKRLGFTEDEEEDANEEETKEEV